MTIERGTYRRADLTERIREFEARFEMSSEDFFTRWEAQEVPHTDEFLEWAGLCSYLGTKELDPA
jgi:hypothetical protein